MERTSLFEDKSPIGKPNDANVPTAIQSHLESGEQLKNWAFGVKGPKPVLMWAILLGAIFIVAPVMNLIIKGILVGDDRRPNPPLILVSFFLSAGIAIVVGALPLAMMTKNYIVGLTDHRFIVLRLGIPLSMSRLDLSDVKETFDFQLNNQVQAKAMQKGASIVLTVGDQQKRFIANFSDSAMPNNRTHTLAIAEALTQKRV